ncbi:hypothetical protein BaRGS_00031450 [Batillaria attramentaria]|uniref:Uncharacterized protein n=1 Tax=Batillaria attramentaria TaxID=370345 RepID=A0ABD0JQR6_9CAEN
MKYYSGTVYSCPAADRIFTVREIDVSLTTSHLSRELRANYYAPRHAVMRSLLTCLVLVTAAFISGTTASWWTRTRDKIEDAATTAAIVAGVGALGGKRASDTDVIPESVMAVLKETCPEVDVSQSVPWTEVLSFAFWEADGVLDFCSEL